MRSASTLPRLHELLERSLSGQPVEDLSEQETAAMEAGRAVLEKALENGDAVYGVTHGFGPLVDFPATTDVEQGTGLVHHLITGQGRPLAPEACRLVVWLRLHSMRQGYSAVSADFWRLLADRWNRGFTPAIPREGTVSASGDLQPLAHAALAFAGKGSAWMRDGSPGWRVVDAQDALAAVGSEPTTWPAREALAFVNGTSVGLAVCMLNHRRLSVLVRAAAVLAARVVELLGADPRAYAHGLAAVRGQPGQATVARWIRERLPPDSRRDPARPLQEPYSVRAVPQVLGALHDQLRYTEEILVREATGVTDNPVFYEGEVLHGANFHALPVGLVSDQLGLCAQQLAFLSERQLGILCDPTRNGGLPPMLSPRPGATSGLAGVQISATSFVSAIRQRVAPASLTALPTNGSNQDHVPMALNGANAVSDALDLATLVVGSLAVAVTQYAARTGAAHGTGLWADLADISPPLEIDRPLAPEVEAAAARLLESAEHLLAKEDDR